MKQVGNALKASEEFWQDNQIISCRNKIYSHKITMNEKLTMTDLTIQYGSIKKTQKIMRPNILV